MLRSPLLCSAQTETKNCTVKYFLDYAPRLPDDTNPTLSRCSRVLASAHLGLHSPAPVTPLLAQAALQPHPIPTCPPPTWLWLAQPAPFTLIPRAWNSIWHSVGTPKYVFYLQCFAWFMQDQFLTFLWCFTLSARMAAMRPSLQLRERERERIDRLCLST